VKAESNPSARADSESAGLKPDQGGHPPRRHPFRRLLVKLLICLGLVIGAVAISSSLAEPKPPVEIRVIDCQGYPWSREIDGEQRSGTNYYAFVAVTNRSKHSFTYTSGLGETYPRYGVVLETPPPPSEKGFRAIRGGSCIVGSATLKPRSGLTFTATLPSAERCRITFTYSETRRWHRFLRYVPRWVRRIIPASPPSHKLTTKVFDPRKPEA